jgi:hypothetical protein
MRRTLGCSLVLALIVTCVGAGSQAASATTAPSVSDGTGPLDTAADLAAALRFEKLIPEHTVGGLVTPLLFDKWPHIDPHAKVLRMDGEGDSGNYTGVYLAAQSWRYAQAKKELAKLGVAPLGNRPPSSPVVAFWRKQRDEARARGREMVAYYHVLVNIAKSWQTEFNPHIDDSRTYDDIGYVDFGGGVFPGEAGLLMRACTPADVDPSKPWGDVRVNGHAQRLVGPLKWNGEDWYCIGATSRDSYAGTIHGLAVALDFLADGANKDLRTTLAHDLIAMTDYAVKYAWFQPRPHGEVANPVFGNNDLDGPISPLFIQVPLHRLHLLQTARHAAKVIGDAEAAQRYNLLWEEEIANTTTSGSLDLSMLIDATRPHEAQYKYQLHLMSFFNVIRLEPDPARRDAFKRALAIMDASTTDDGNAFYETILYALTGEQQRRDEAVTYHRQWLDYYSFHEDVARRGTTPFVHTGRCSITEDPGPGAPIEKRPLECVPMDQVYMSVTLPDRSDVETLFTPGVDEELRARHPLPVGVRRYADFLWQKDPMKITGDHKDPWRGPSIDFLGTYWMLRYYSEVKRASTASPLPAWLGPRFS